MISLPDMRNEILCAVYECAYTLPTARVTIETLSKKFEYSTLKTPESLLKLRKQVSMAVMKLVNDEWIRFEPQVNGRNVHRTHFNILPRIKERTVQLTGAAINETMIMEDDGEA